MIDDQIKIVEAKKMPAKDLAELPVALLLLQGLAATFRAPCPRKTAKKPFPSQDLYFARMRVEECLLWQKTWLTGSLNDSGPPI